MDRWNEKKFPVMLKDCILNFFNRPLEVIVHNGRGASASYCKGTSACQIQFFYKVLGKDWFNLEDNKKDITTLIIHEFGHFYSSNHLSEQYYDGLCDIGAEMYLGFPSLKK